MEGPIIVIFTLILLTACFLTVLCLFLLTVFKTLKLIDERNRLMRPGQVWLMLIPIFNLYWTFMLARNVSYSIYNEFRSRGLPIKPKPTFALGFSFAALSFTSAALGWRALAHPPQWLISISNLATIIIWIAYWISVSDYKKRLKQLPQTEEESLIFGKMSTKHNT